MGRGTDLAVTAFRRLHGDARHWQILALSGLFVLSLTQSDFGATPMALAAALCGTLLAQLVGTAGVNSLRRGPAASPNTDGLAGLLQGFEWKSAAITALSLSILLRAADLWVWLAAGLIAVGAKFLIRRNNKHLFNPACIGIVSLSLLLGTGAWVSPGQWGQAPLFAAFATGLAALVLSSARRLDIALGFLGFFAAILIARALWLGDPLAIPLHKLQNGALLVFAFFMITDPRSTPDSRPGRLVLAFCVALLAAWMAWEHHVRAPMLYALALLAPLTPLLDRLMPAERFQWTSNARKGRCDAPHEMDRGLPARALRP